MDGSSEHADLIVGADGIGSVVREAVAPGTEPRYAGDVAFRGLASEARLPKESAALVSERFTFFDAPGSQFLGYLVAGADGSPERGRRRFNWVWYRQLTAKQLAAALTSEPASPRYSVPFSGLPRQPRRSFAWLPRTCCLGSGQHCHAGDSSHSSRPSSMMRLQG